MTTRDMVRKARERLRAAADRACIARGEAQWTSGYRCAYVKTGEYGDAEEKRLYAKEIEQFKACGRAEGSLEREMRRFAAAIRADVRARGRKR